MKIREYTEADLNSMVAVWNEVVEEGVAFPQETFLDRNSGGDFFASQSYTAVADDNGQVVGTYSSSECIGKNFYCIRYYF